MAVESKFRDGIFWADAGLHSSRIAFIANSSSISDAFCCQERELDPEFKSRPPPPNFSPLPAFRETSKPLDTYPREVGCLARPLLHLALRSTTSLPVAGFRVSLKKGEGVCFGRAHPRAARDLGILLVRSAFTHKPHLIVDILFR